MDSPSVAGRVVVTGGSGFLGVSLARCLTAGGAEVVLVSRGAPSVEGPWTHVEWDARTVGEWARSLDGAAAVVNLAGRTVDCIKTPEHCDEILRSRVESTRAVGRALAEVESPPPVWVQMSTAHCYGDPPDLVCDEDSAFGYGLAPQVAEAWERAFEETRPASVRGVALRTSFVLGRSGGALTALARLARWGLGGTIAHGRQGMSWIHEEDMNRLFVRSIVDPSMEGAYIATAPHPVSNREFMRRLRRAVGAPIGLPAAGWMVRIGARWLLRTDPELALLGRYVVPKRLTESGFRFRFEELEAAFADLFGGER